MATPTLVPLTHLRMPKVELVISTYHKDFPWLAYCLRSIRKFVTGFHQHTVHVPHRDLPALCRLLDQEGPFDNLRIVDGGNEWPGRGFMWRQHEVCHMDRIALPESDFIAHLDADSIFTALTTPEQYFEQGKPYLRYAPYSVLGSVVAQWQTYTQRCLSFPVENETMRCYPFIYPRRLYPTVRYSVECAVRMPFTDYLKAVQPGSHHPWGFSEYNVLGSVAMHHFPEQFRLVDTSREQNPPTNLELFWSHGGITPAVQSRMAELGL